MGVEQMKEYWSPENILVDDQELLVLRVLTGPSCYSYAVYLRGAKMELEFQYSVKDRVLVPSYTASKFEKRLLASLREVNDDMENVDGEGQHWKTRRA